MPDRQLPLRQQVHEVMRFLRYSPRTEAAYWHWITRFLRHFRKADPTGSVIWRHPRDLGGAEVRDYLTYLATELQVSAATQNQALNALVFLYDRVLHLPLGEVGEFARAKRPPRLPVVLSRDEVRRVLEAVEPEFALPLKLLYGTGLRLFELLQLRVKDLDLARGEILVREGKGSKDRRTMIPEVLRQELEVQTRRVRELHASDLAAGYCGVFLPDALERKYPAAPRELAWQWVFPARSLTAVRTGPEAVEWRRYHQFPEHLQRAMKAAVARAKVAK